MIAHSKPNNRFLVAKYVPDLRRMEPKNIGVFVWVEGAVTARFLSDVDAKFIDDKKNYLRWRSFWNDQIAGDEIVPIRGPAVSKESPDFMDALLKTQEGSYLLREGGAILSELERVEADDAADFLFNELVAVHRPKEAPSHETLTILGDKVMAESGLSTRPDFHERVPLHLPIFEIPQDVIFDYSIGDDKASLCVYQKVSLRTTLHTARGTAVAFDALRRSNRIRRKKQCCSLIDSTENNANLDLVEMLRKVGTVIDMADVPRAVSEVRELAELSS